MSLEVTPDQVEDLLHRCAGVTASFIKELLRRASLIAAEREDNTTHLRVTAAELREATEDLLSTRNRITRVVLGATDQVN